MNSTEEQNFDRYHSKLALAFRACLGNATEAETLVSISRKTISERREFKSCSSGWRGNGSSVSAYLHLYKQVLMVVGGTKLVLQSLDTNVFSDGSHTVLVSKSYS